MHTTYPTPLRDPDAVHRAISADGHRSARVRNRKFTRGRVVAGLIVVAIAVFAALPFLVFECPYGEVPIPGTAIVHLPAGETDVAVRTVGPADEPVAPLSIHIVGPEGTAPPQVTENPRTKHTSAQSDMLVRVWTVRVAQEGDYRVEVQGEVCCPYEPTLVFGRNMWNEPLETLIAVGATLSWQCLATAAAGSLIGLPVWAYGVARRKRGVPSS